MKQKSELTFKERNVLELMEANAKDVNDALDTLDRKAWQNISVSSIIVGFVAAFNLNEVRSFLETPFFLVAIVGVYLASLILSLRVLTPKPHSAHPLKPTWDEAQRVLQKDLDKYYDWVLASYEEVIVKNTELMNFKASNVRNSTMLLGVDVILVALAALSKVYGWLGLLLIGFVAVIALCIAFFARRWWKYFSEKTNLRVREERSDIESVATANEPPSNAASIQDHTASDNAIEAPHMPQQKKS